ncbi:MAG: hypothetical protein RLZZ380_1140 [Actinomycetota bacterium]|jgi:hypothetical protein
MWQDISGILIAHPLACLLSLASAIYLTVISARGIGRDTKRRNEKLGIVYPARAQREYDQAAVGAVLFLFLAFLVGLYFLLTWIGSLLPIRIGL